MAKKAAARRSTRSAAKTAKAAPAQAARRAPGTTAARKAALPTVAPPASVSRDGIRVRATRIGYFEHKRRRPGDTFTIQSMDQFGTWMEFVDKRTKESITTPNEAIQQRHDEILGGRAVGDRSGEQQADEHDDNPLNAD